MIVSAQEMKAAEERLFATGVEAETLMDEAALGCAHAISQFFPKPARATLFCGKGNNAGDTYAIGVHLRQSGWIVDSIESHEQECELTALAQKKRQTFLKTSDGKIASAHLHHILIDGLLGIGTDGPLRGKIGTLAGQINQMRGTEHAPVFAIDMPSGIGHENGVVADLTLSICEVKSELLEDHVIDQVGRLVKIPLPILHQRLEGMQNVQVINSDLIRSWMAPRRFGNHKGTAGRVAIIAGSRGLTGAAALCALGALKGGAGLVSVFVEPAIYEIVASTAPAEVMVSTIEDASSIRDFNADVLAIGPGLGPEIRTDVLEVIKNDSRPIVIDADGLNWLSQSDALPKFTGPRLLTPHPGEMARLIPPESNQSRFEAAKSLAGLTGASVLLKGSRSVIVDADESSPSYFNSTGHPGMATGGIGDVLTGLCAALIASGMNPTIAAATGSWLIGRSAEMAIYDGDESTESLSAAHIADGLGRAFSSAKLGEF